MTKKEAISIIENEIACVKSACDRQCGICSLSKTEEEIVSAMQMAIRALSERDKQTVERRALRIAAIVMRCDGLCRYGSAADCKRVWPPEESYCVKCIERWLLAKARRELKKKSGAA